MSRDSAAREQGKAPLAKAPWAMRKKESAVWQGGCQDVTRTFCDSGSPRASNCLALSFSGGATLSKFLNLLSLDFLIWKMG